MPGFTRNFKPVRVLWCIFLFIYFYHFPKNFFTDALSERSAIPIFFFQSFSFWLIIEYYFSSPFFQSGVLPFSSFFKSLFSLYFYPYLVFLIFDYGWWGRGQIKFLYPYINFFGLGLFLFGVLFRLLTLFLFIAYPVGRLIKKWLFRFSRHPRYLATAIQLVSLPLVFSSFLGILLLLPGFYLIKKEVEFEDRGLREYLKKDYERYLKNVPLLYPGWRVLIKR
jgi:protein-S-isoprenylcysteine O-methyltransferase Ste14